MSALYDTKNDLAQIGLKVTDHVTAMLAYWDKNLICRFANEAYKEWFGRSKEQMIGRIHLKELLGDLFDLNWPFIQGALSGRTQVFEREIPLPGGGSRHSLATYQPHIENEVVLGFFVHVADVSYVKELEIRLSNAKREMLRTLIQTQENERGKIVVALNEGIAQTLSYCKMVLGKTFKEAVPLDSFGNAITDGIQQAINDLKIISNNLAPSTIEYFGFVAGTRDYLLNYNFKEATKTEFICDDKTDTLKFIDKVSLFRIVQGFLTLIAGNTEPQTVRIVISFDNNILRMQLSTTNLAEMINKDSREYRDMLFRVDYYEGKMHIHEVNNEKIISIELKVPEC